MIKALIIEDENPAALRLETLLKRLEPDIDIIGRIDTVEAAVRWFRTNPHPDLILLDIQLGDGLSFDIFGKTNVESYIIFTTAFDEYAIRAFELNSVDYLLKPVDEERLAKSLAKFKKFRGSEKAINYEQLLEIMDRRVNRYKKRFVITVSGKIKIVETEDVAFFYSKEKYTFLCTSENRNYPVEFSLDQLEPVLNPDLFFRVNRQYLVQFKSIGKIDILSKSRIRILTIPPAGEEVLVSSGRTPEFRAWLDR